MTKRLTDDILKGLLMAAAIAAALPIPDFAFAAGAQDLASSVTQVHANIDALPNLIAGAFYIGGTVMIGAGLIKLKQHSENPGQVPLGHGVGRVVIGGGLLAIPLFGKWVLNTVGNTGGPSAYTPMAPIAGAGP